MRREGSCRKCSERIRTGRNWCATCLLELARLGERRRLAAMGIVRTVLGR